MSNPNITEDSLLYLLNKLEEAELRIEKLWFAKFGVKNSANDHIAKMIEELGEAMRASEENDPEHELEEIIDSVVAVLTISFVRGFKPAQVYKAFFKVQRKIEDRWLSDDPPLERLR